MSTMEGNSNQYYETTEEMAAAIKKLAQESGNWDEERGCTKGSHKYIDCTTEELAQIAKEAGAKLEESLRSCEARVKRYIKSVDDLVADFDSFTKRCDRVHEEASVLYTAVVGKPISTRKKGKMRARKRRSPAKHALRR